MEALPNGTFPSECWGVCLAVELVMCSGDARGGGYM